MVDQRPPTSALAGLLRPPRFRAGEPSEGERHATWFELFFDLVFVVAVAELAHGLAEDASVAGFARFGLLFLPVWWTWILYTFYADRFDTDDVLYRLLGMVGMFAIVTMGVGLDHAGNGEGVRQDLPFVLAYLAARWVSCLLYLRAAFHLEIGRRLVRIHATGSVLASVIWLGSLALPDPARYWLWFVALLVEMVVPAVARQTLAAVPASLDHIPERFGLFTIIVLGESVISVAAGLEDGGVGGRPFVIAVAFFLLACALWWFYFDFADAEPLRHSFAVRQIYIYGHFLTVVSLTAIGAGALRAIEHAGDGSLDAGTRWAIGGGLTLFLVAAAAVRIVVMSSPRLPQLPRFRYLALMIVGGLTFAVSGGAVGPVVGVVLLVAGFVAYTGQKVLMIAARDAAKIAAEDAHADEFAVDAIPQPAEMGD